MLSLVVSSKGNKHDMFSVVNVNLDEGKLEDSDTISGEDFKAVIRKSNKNYDKIK